MLDQKVQIFLENMKKAGESRNVPNISWDTARFLRETIKKYNIQSVFEIGSANGFSTIHLAEAIKEHDGQVVSVDLSRNAFEEAVENFSTYEKLIQGHETSLQPSEKTKHDNSGIETATFKYIQYYFCNALDLIEFFLTKKEVFLGKIPPSIFPYSGIRSFDLVFIDGRFKNTLKFYLLAKKILHPNGLIIVDDVVKYKWKMEEFYTYLDQNSVEYRIEMTDEDDGVMILA